MEYRLGDGRSVGIAARVLQAHRPDDVLLHDLGQRLGGDLLEHATEVGSSGIQVESLSSRPTFF